ncbi:MAG: DALR domain-containing protein, partial [Elusimicrobiota bacterium]
IKGAYLIACEKSKGLNLSHKKVEDPYLFAFEEALANDLNTPVALAALNQVCSDVFSLEKENSNNTNEYGIKKCAMDSMFEVLGITLSVESDWSQEILDLAQQRESARKSKDWKKSDDIRDLLKSKGVLIEDTSSGQRLKKIS